MLPTKYIWKVEFYNSSGHKHDLNNKISKVQNQPWVLESLIYEGVTLEIKKISFKQSSLYIHPFPQSQPNFFIYPSSAQ